MKKPSLTLARVDALPPLLRELVWATDDIDCAKRYLQMGIRTFEEAEEQMAREGISRLVEQEESALIRAAAARIRERRGSE